MLININIWSMAATTSTHLDMVKKAADVQASEWKRKAILMILMVLV